MMLDVFCVTFTVSKIYITRPTDVCVEVGLVTGFEPYVQTVLHVGQNFEFCGSSPLGELQTVRPDEIQHG